MNKSPKSAISLIVLALAAAIVCGCGTPKMVVGDKPEDNLNPAMPEHQKQVRLGQLQKNGGPTATP